MISIPLTEPQEDFAFSEDTFPAIVGGLGSGKSRAATMRVILLMIEEYKITGNSIDTLITMPSYDLLKLRAMPGVENDLDLMGLGYSTNKSDYSIKISGLGKILFRSYDTPERIIAFEVAHSILDELDTLPKDKAAVVWRKVSERTRQKCHKPNSIGVVTTPDQGINGFVYEKWEKKKQPGYVIYKAPTASNPYLPDGYIEQIRSNYDPILADMYLSGEFVSLTHNKVYHFFSRDKHHTTREITDNDYIIHVGIDFNIGGCCAVAFIIENNAPVAVDEFVSHDTQDLINNLSRYGGKDVICYPDASGRNGHTNSSATDIQLIEGAGYEVDAPDANPFVRDRVNSFNALLAHSRFKINTDKCPNVAQALETQGYNKKNEPEKWNDHPAIDDWTDSSGYFINRKFPILCNIAERLEIGGI